MLRAAAAVALLLLLTGVQLADAARGGDLVGTPPLLLASVLAGYLVGLALALFAQHPSVPPAWRLFAITGFLGGLTTFSTFSGESVLLLGRGQYGWALAHTALHLFGSLAACAAGFATWRALFA